MVTRGCSEAIRGKFFFFFLFVLFLNNYTSAKKSTPFCIIIFLSKNDKTESSHLRKTLVSLFVKEEIETHVKPIFQEKKGKTQRENYFHRGRALTKPPKNLSTKILKKAFPLKIVGKKIIIANDKQGGAYVNWRGFVIRIQACHNSSFAFCIPSPRSSLGLCSIDFFPHTLLPPPPPSFPTHTHTLFVSQ